MLIRLITTVVTGAAIGMILIAGVNMSNFITGLMWIGAFLILFLLPKSTDSEEDER